MATRFSGAGSRREPPTMGKQLVRLRVECILFVVYKTGREPTCLCILSQSEYLSPCMLRFTFINNTDSILLVCISVVLGVLVLYIFHTLHILVLLHTTWYYLEISRGILRFFHGEVMMTLETRYDSCKDKC